MLFTEQDFPARFAAAAAAGFKGVECLFPYDYPAKLLAERLEAAGLEQVLFNLPPGDWAAGDRGLACLAERVGEFRDGVALALDYARVLGCPRLHVLAGIPAAETPRERAFETYVENLQFAADAAAELGITLLVEPINSRDMPGYLIARIADAMAAIEAACRPNIALQFDFYHVQIMEGDLSRQFEAAFGRIGHVQIAGVPERHEPDSGEVCYPHLFTLMDRLGYRGWVGCEYRPRAGTEAGLGWLREARSGERVV